MEDPDEPPLKISPFWTSSILQKSAQMVDMSRKQDLRKINDHFKEVYNRTNAQIDLQYEQSQNSESAVRNVMTHDQYLSLKNENHWEIAWQIFDQVNCKNDTNQLIDLHCLDVEEGVAITKQKIYDLATIVSKDKRSPKVLMVVCSSVQYTPNNCIRAMVKNEL